MKKISVLLEQTDGNIAGENLLPENEAEVTPELLSSLADRLNKSLENTPKPEDKEGKAVLREKKRQVKELVKLPVTGTPVPRQTGTPLSCT